MNGQTDKIKYEYNNYHFFPVSGNYCVHSCYFFLNILSVDKPLT